MIETILMGAAVFLGGMVVVAICAAIPVLAIGYIIGVIRG